MAILDNRQKDLIRKIVHDFDKNWWRELELQQIKNLNLVLEITLQRLKTKPEESVINIPKELYHNIEQEHVVILLNQVASKSFADELFWVVNKDYQRALDLKENPPEDENLEKILSICEQAKFTPNDISRGVLLIIHDPPSIISSLEKLRNEVIDELLNRENGIYNGTEKKFEWQDDFKWKDKTFVFGEYGEIPFTSPIRRILFEILTAKKGAWVSVRSISEAIHKDDTFTRTTIGQIEARIKPKLRRYVSIPSTQEDDAPKKPSSGSYRIKFTSNPSSLDSK